MLCLSDEERQRFDANGFVVVDSVIDPQTAREASERFDELFRGVFDTGLMPDEWNWREGRDPVDLTRQICNGWKSDYTLARIVLRADIGRTCAELMGWPGARLNQDNVIWKPSGAGSLGFHQDDSYQSWIVPQEMATCWIALDDTSAEGGTIEYVQGSHRWGLSPPIGQFHDPPDPELEMRAAAAAAGVEPEVVGVEVGVGSCALHHGRIWHGSGINRSQRPRRSLSVHCMSSEAHFHPTNIGSIYGRYKRAGDLCMEESFFPILWTSDGHRSSFLEDYLNAAGDHHRG